MESLPTGLIRTLLVEDHEITRLGLRIVLEHIPEINVIAEAADGKSAVEKAIELRPALVLMDVGLPIMDGIEATRSIKKVLQTKVILITSHRTQEDVFAGLTAGADAYCLKGINVSQLSTAIRSVLNDALWLDPNIAKHVVTAIAAATPDFSQTNQFELTERELQVLSLLVSGSSNQAMADQLFVSAETVKTHMRHIMEKLRVSDRTQAAVKAVRQGLISSQ